MTTKNRTAIRAAESESDDFSMLMHRFLLATERLQLAEHAQERGEDYGPATCVVEEATEALGRWSSTYGFGSRSFKPVFAPRAMRPSNCACSAATSDSLRPAR